MSIMDTVWYKIVMERAAIPIIPPVQGKIAMENVGIHPVRSPVLRVQAQVLEQAVVTTAKVTEAVDIMGADITVK